MEFVIVTPLLLAALLFVVGGGRLGMARGDVDGAARDAARAASLARSLAAAEPAARAAAVASLSDRGVSCNRLEVTVEPQDFRAGGAVAVDVVCGVELSDLTLVWTPGSKDIASRFVEPIDAYRGLR